MTTPYHIKNLKHPPVFIDNTYNTAPQMGGSAPRKRRKNHASHQAGGFSFAPIIAAGTAAYNLLKQYKPFTKANDALETHISDAHKNTRAYKVAHGITSFGKSLGLGPPPPKRKRKSHKK